MYQKSLIRLENGEEIKRPTRPKTSKFIGVGYVKNIDKWQARIRINGKLTHLGYFTDELEAHATYENALDN